MCAGVDDVGTCGSSVVICPGELVPNKFIEALYGDDCRETFAGSVRTNGVHFGVIFS